MEIGRAQRRVGTVVRAGGDAGGNVQRAAQGDHQVREVAAHAHLLHQGIDGRGGRVAGGRGEGHQLLHPLLYGQHARIAGRQVAEIAEGQLHQPVGLAIAAGVDVGQDLQRDAAHRNLAQRRRILAVVRDADGGRVGQVQGAGVGMQAHEARGGGGLGGNVGLHGLTEHQTLVLHRLVRGVGRMDVEHEIGPGRIADVISKIHLDLQPDRCVGHCLSLVGVSDRHHGAGSHARRP